MKTHLIKAKDNIISHWSGGTTSQIYIYPEDAVYAERNFLFRLSMANAEIEDSVYTDLPGVKRYLVSLKGECNIVHEKRSVHLAPFENIDCFMGDDHTEAHGVITDFNLMLKGVDGEMSFIHEKKLLCEKSYSHYALFSYSDAVILADNKQFFLSEGDLLLITDADDELISLIKGTEKMLLCRIKDIQ